MRAGAAQARALDAKTRATLEMVEQRNADASAIEATKAALLREKAAAKDALAYRPMTRSCCPGGSVALVPHVSPPRRHS